MASPTQLRKARPEDVGAIAEISRDHIERGLKWTWKAKRVAKTLADKNVLAVVSGDNVDGFCIMQYGDERAHLLLIGVRPDVRRGGLGTELVQWHLECARVAGMTQIWLELRATNAIARKFYEQMGFTVTARVRRYYQDREDALRMALTL